MSFSVGFYEKTLDLRLAWLKDISPGFTTVISPWGGFLRGIKNGFIHVVARFFHVHASIGLLGRVI